MLGDSNASILDWCWHYDLGSSWKPVTWKCSSTDMFSCSEVLTFVHTYFLHVTVRHAWSRAILTASDSLKSSWLMMAVKDAADEACCFLAWWRRFQMKIFPSSPWFCLAKSRGFWTVNFWDIPPTSLLLYIHFLFSFPFQDSYCK